MKNIINYYSHAGRFNVFKLCYYLLFISGEFPIQIVTIIYWCALDEILGSCLLHIYVR